MNQYLDIIPTPKQVSFQSGAAIKVAAVCVLGEIPRVLKHALGMLQQDSPYVMAACEEADLVIYHGLEWVPDGILTEEDRGTFENRFAAEQGYVLKRSAEGPIVIAAMQEKGCVYGIMTLLQLLGKEVGELCIRDWPDFAGRTIKWLIWAELGIWSYDYGDGIEAYQKRIERKYDTLLRYKLTGVNNRNYGFATNPFPGYDELMVKLRESGLDRGFGVSCAGYSMGYGMLGYDGTYQGSGYLNRKSYPDGEIYECIGTYDPYRFIDDKTVDRSVRLTEVRAREYGTCLSNDALTEEKLKELCKVVKMVHPSAISFHNMDSHEVHPEIWLARCDQCRRKWPNDDLFAEDGFAGAFAYYIDKLIDGIHGVRDGDWDARNVVVAMASPGYCYAEITEDEDFDVAVRFWTSVQKYMKNKGKFSSGFREQYFYHNKPVRRAETLAKYVDTGEFRCSMGFFTGGDGFYDDKLISTTSALMFIGKGVNSTSIQSGNAFQEPQQLINAEYMWNAEHSGFYNLDPKPANQEEYLKTFDDFLHSRVEPEEICGEGGMIDVICDKLYGTKIGSKMAALYKLRGKNGEQPIPCASSVDIYTNFTKIVFPMRWDYEEITEEQIAAMTERFEQCSIVTSQAYAIMQEVVEEFDGENDRKTDLIWLCECFEMGSMLTALLHEYMVLYGQLHPSFGEGKAVRADLAAEIEKLRGKIHEYIAWVDASPRKPIDKFGGSLVRRRSMGEQLDYWTGLMLSSIRTGKRIPEDVKPLPTKKWW